jgi:dihydrofolate synthase / folylpolyglutamate synthase
MVLAAVVTAYQSILRELFPRSTQGIKLGLQATQALFAALDHPDARLPNVLVAGTNGKGSTSFMLSEVVRAAGLRVGLFT